MMKRVPPAPKSNKRPPPPPAQNTNKSAVTTKANQQQIQKQRQQSFPQKKAQQTINPFVSQTKIQEESNSLPEQSIQQQSYKIPDSEQKQKKIIRSPVPPNKIPKIQNPKLPIKQVTDEIEQNVKQSILQPVTHSEQTKSTDQVKENNALTSAKKEHLHKQNFKHSVYNRLQNKLKNVSNAVQQLQLSGSSSGSQQQREVMSQPNHIEQFSQRDTQKRIQTIDQQQSHTYKEGKVQNIENIQEQVFRNQQPIIDEQFVQDSKNQLQTYNDLYVEQFEDREVSFGQTKPNKKKLSFEELKKQAQQQQNVKVEQKAKNEQIQNQNVKTVSSNISKQSNKMSKKKVQIVNTQNTLLPQIKQLMNNFETIKNNYNINRTKFKQQSKLYQNQENQRFNKIQKLLDILGDKDRQIKELLAYY